MEENRTGGWKARPTGQIVSCEKVKIVLALSRQVYILGVLGGPCHGPEAGVPMGASAFAALRRDGAGGSLTY